LIASCYAILYLCSLVEEGELNNAIPYFKQKNPKPFPGKHVFTIVRDRKVFGGIFYISQVQWSFW